MKACDLYFQTGYPKFTKISFIMNVDRNAVIKLHKSGKNNVKIAKRLDMNRSTAWKIVKKFQETPLTDQNTKENGVSGPLNSSKTRGKSCDETLAEAAEPTPTQPELAKKKHQVLKDDLGVKSLKMLYCQ